MKLVKTTHMENWGHGPVKRHRDLNSWFVVSSLNSSTIGECKSNLPTFLFFLLSDFTETAEVPTVAISVRECSQ